MKCKENEHQHGIKKIQPLTTAAHLGAEMRKYSGPFPRGDGVIIPLTLECIITTMFLTNHVGTVRRRLSESYGL